MPNSAPATRSHGLVPSFLSPHQPRSVPSATDPTSCQLASMYGCAFRYEVTTSSRPSGRSLRSLPAIRCSLQSGAVYHARDRRATTVCYGFAMPRPTDGLLGSSKAARRASLRAERLKAIGSAIRGLRAAVNGLVGALFQLVLLCAL